VDTLLDINAGIHVHNVLESSFDLTQFKVLHEKLVKNNNDSQKCKHDN